MADIDTIRRSVRSPRSVAQRIYDRTDHHRAELQRLRRLVPKQRRLIHQFVNQGRFLLVILDACRYDAFERAIEGRLSGRLSKVWGSGHWTAEYLETTWTDEYPLTYLAAGPVASDYYFEQRGSDYRPSEHFSELVPLWRTHWDSERGTVPAEAVTDVALDRMAHGQLRTVAHYIQPHVPHIGATENLPWTKVPEAIADAERNEYGEGHEVALAQDGEGATARIHEQVTSGNLSESRLIRGYYHNLEYVLNQVERLVRYAPYPVVITSDHGEHLGEEGRYLHHSESPVTREVPWFIVDEGERGIESLQSIRTADGGGSPPAKSSNPNDEEVIRRLENLGYVD